MSRALGYCHLSSIQMEYRIPLPGTNKVPSFVPPNNLEDAVSGKYIDLQEFLPQEFFKPWDNSITMKHDSDTDPISFHRTLPVQQIETLTDWLRAWSSYERVLTNADCTLYHELASHTGN